MGAGASINDVRFSLVFLPVRTFHIPSYINAVTFLSNPIPFLSRDVVYG